MPLNTFTFLVEGHLSGGVLPLRNLVLGRVPGFYQKLIASPSKEVAMMAVVAAADARTVLASNLKHVSSLSGLDCKAESASAVKTALPVTQVPPNEVWRLGLLDILLRQRGDLEKEGVDTRTVVAMLSSLCTT